MEQARQQLVAGGSVAGANDVGRDVARVQRDVEVSAVTAEKTRVLQSGQVAPAVGQSDDGLCQRLILAEAHEALRIYGAPLGTDIEREGLAHDGVPWGEGHLQRSPSHLQHPDGVVARRCALARFLIGGQVCEHGLFLLADGAQVARVDGVSAEVTEDVRRTLEDRALDLRGVQTHARRCVHVQRRVDAAALGHKPQGFVDQLC
mmetsp:Transcript_123582/g.335595  ORF Transcript_123582/g.335595 Transcript_123582/m.335595 type:complete len:204 (-) Transcript_123582:526-1137(-)